MLRSSELVMKLNGTDTEQAADTDGAYELVFGRSMGKPSAAVLRPLLHSCLPHLSCRPAQLKAYTLNISWPLC